MLGKVDWIAAAQQVLVAESINAVQVTRLSSDLGVTRGSFYWHFKDRGNLLSELIEEWQHLNSGVMKEALGGVNDLDDGILALFKVWVSTEPFNAQLDQAMRDWARQSEAVKEIVDQEDQSRIATIQAFFADQSYEETEAFIRARIIYFTQISYYALGVNEPMAKRLSYLKEYYRCFTGKDLDPQKASAYSALYEQMEKVA
jgi:AcrR family transcriptional regulator